MDKNRKILLSIVISICFVFLLNGKNIYVYAQENVTNPFSLSATDLDSDGYFTVNINVSTDCAVEAFKVVIKYDSTQMELKEGKYGYGNYVTFLNKYNSNKNGLCVNNHIKEEAKIIFTGAQADNAVAKLNAGDRVGYATFKIKSSAENQKPFEEVINSISMKVDNCYDGEKDYSKEYEEIFKTEIIPQPGDTLRGENITLGDVNDDGKIDLNDAKYALRASLGIIKLEADNEFAADVDKDAKVTLKDAKLLLKYALGIIKSFE